MYMCVGCITLARDGCLRGWQLLVICTAYFPCSSLLLPYLLHFLRSHSSDHKESEFHGTNKHTVIEDNIKSQQSWKYHYVVCNIVFCLFVCFWLSSPEDSFYHLVYSVPAIISESNLRKTFRFGGRREPPTAAEIKAIVVSMSHAVGGDGGWIDFCERQQYTGLRGKVG